MVAPAKTLEVLVNSEGLMPKAWKCTKCKFPNKLNTMHYITGYYMVRAKSMLMACSARDIVALAHATEQVLQLLQVVHFFNN